MKVFFFIILSLYTTGIAIVLYGIKYHFWQNSNAYAKVGISVFFIALAINCLVVIFGYLGSDISKFWWWGNVSLLVLVMTGIAIKYFVFS